MIKPAPDEPTLTPTQRPDLHVTDVVATPDRVSLTPGESTTIKLEVQPPGTYPIELSLDGGTGAAFIGESVLTTDDQGRAETTLTVVSANVEPFILQMFVGTFYKTVKVVVSPKASANVLIVPKYAGSRATDQWTVTYNMEPSCVVDYEAYAGSDESPAVTSAAGASEVQLEGVPAEEPVTLLVSSKQYVFGCVSANVFAPMSSSTVEVQMANRAADTSKVAFPIRFNVDEQSEFWPPLADYLDALTQRFRGGSATDIEALLLQMQTLSDAPELFAAASAANNWPSVLDEQLTPEGAKRGLTSRISLWLDEGAKRLSLPGALSGTLTATETTGRAVVRLDSVAGLDPESAGMPSVYQASLTVDAQDILRVGFTVLFQPSVLFAELASQVAAERSVGAGLSATNAVDALSEALGCSLIGQWLTPNSVPAYAECGTECLTQLCNQALEASWNEVRSADPAGATFDVNAAGAALLDDRAYAVGFSGTWRGETDLFSDITVSMQGAVTSETSASDSEATP